MIDFGEGSEIICGAPAPVPKPDIDVSCHPQRNNFLALLAGNAAMTARTKPNQDGKWKLLRRVTTSS
jgi:hypothetical protein